MYLIINNAHFSHKRKILPMPAKILSKVNFFKNNNDLARRILKVYETRAACGPYALPPCDYGEHRVHVSIALLLILKNCVETLQIVISLLSAAFQLFFLTFCSFLRLKKPSSINAEQSKYRQRQSVLPQFYLSIVRSQEIKQYT